MRRKICGVQPTIQTMNGDAGYIGTEIENENGRWNDDYYIRDGYYVIHEGRFHHVYSIHRHEVERTRQESCENIPMD